MGIILAHRGDFLPHHPEDLAHYFKLLSMDKGPHHKTTTTTGTDWHVRWQTSKRGQGWNGLREGPNSPLAPLSLLDRIKGMSGGTRVRLPVWRSLPTPLTCWARRVHVHKQSWSSAIAFSLFSSPFERMLVTPKQGKLRFCMHLLKYLGKGFKDEETV